MHLEKGISVNEFLQDFPTVKKSQVKYVLEIAEKLLSSSKIEALIKTIA